MKMHLVIVLIVITGCASKDNEVPELSVQASMSYKIDINREAYITLYASGPPHETRFTFTGAEKDSIWKM